MEENTPQEGKGEARIQKSIGRPLKFATPEEFTAKANEYFANTPKEEWIITGLAVYLDTSRETLMNYQKRDAFFDAVKKAKDMIESSYEIDLKKKGNSGSIFGLKNFGWVDRVDHDLTSKGEKINFTRDLSDAELLDLASGSEGGAGQA